MLSENENNLWQAILNFPLDIATAKLKFSDRLARENNWSQAYTKNVIAEYRKFLFLCCVTPKGKMVTPSDAVDMAWHLHLTYTKSYWKDLCEKTLKQEIHHNPTEGGMAENQKFENCYEHTFALYYEKFGTKPPENIWLDSQQRFKPDKFIRINTTNYFLFKKPNWLQKIDNFRNYNNFTSNFTSNSTKITTFSLLIICVLSLFFIQADMGIIISVIQVGIFLFALRYFFKTRKEMKKIREQELNNKINLQKKPITKLNLQKTENKDNSVSQDTGDVGFIIVGGILDDFNSNDSNSGDSSSGDSGGDGGSGCGSGCGGGCGG